MARTAFYFAISLLLLSPLIASDERLVLQLSSGIIQERANAAYLLGMSKDPGAASLLLHQLEEEANRENQLVMIESLRKLGSKEGYAGLSRFYQKSLDRDVRRKVVQVLGESGDGSFVGLIAKSLSFPDLEDQREALAALSRIQHPDAVQALLQYFANQPSRHQREWALSAIAAQKRETAVSPLIRLGNQSPDPGERVRIAEALSEIGDHRAQEAIFLWFQEADDPVSKKRLVRSLKSVGGSSMIGRMAGALESQAIPVQEEIVGLLICIDPDAAVPYLRRFYQQSIDTLDPGVSRLQAAAVIRFHKFLRNFLSINENPLESYPEEWRNDPILHHLIVS